MTTAEAVALGASVLWSDEQHDAYQLGMQTEREHQNALSRLVMEKHKAELEQAHRGASVPSDIAETIKESVNYAKKSVNELGKRSLTQREIDFAIARFDAALTWLAQQREQG